MEITPIQNILDTIEFNLCQPSGFTDKQREFWEGFITGEVNKSVREQIKRDLDIVDSYYSRIPKWQLMDIISRKLISLYE